ncbi:MAG: hypothetical protein ACJ72N_26135 [Labedaea sp.]
MRFGVFLMIIGFGSSILHFTGYQFRLVGWAEEWQPGLGIAIGGTGILVAVLVSTLRERRNQGAGGQPPAYPQQPYPAQPGPQQHFGYQPAPGQPPVTQPAMTQPVMAQPPAARPAGPPQFFPQQSTPYGGQPVPKFPPRPADPPAPQFGQQAGDFRPQDQ